MNPRNRLRRKPSNGHGRREDSVLQDLLDYCPRFLDVPSEGWVAVPEGQDPPDLVDSRGRIGLELTEWLHPGQTTEAIRRSRIRKELLRVLNDQRPPAPQNYRIVYVSPRWGRLSHKDSQALRQEFHTMCQQRDLRWYSDPAVERGWTWVVEQEFATYPTVKKYFASVRFKADGSNIAQHGFPWIWPEPEGGAQDASNAIHSLRELIIKKCRMYVKNRRLAKKQLRQLVLLIHSGPMRAILNSPYDLDYPDLLQNLRHVVSQIGDLSAECLVFKSIWLFQRPLDKEEQGRDRWLARIYPADDTCVLLSSDESQLCKMM